MSIEHAFLHHPSTGLQFTGGKEFYMQSSSDGYNLYVSGDNQTISIDTLSGNCTVIDTINGK